MVRRLALIGLASLLLAACGSSATPTPQPARTSSLSAAPSGAVAPSNASSGDPAAIGTAFIGALSRGDDAGAQAVEDATMRAAAPAATLGQLWAQFVAQYGDYQVPPSELQPWVKALEGRTNVTFRTYPAMDHLLFDGSGPATPAEYSVPGHIDLQLVADVATWIRR